MLQTVQACGAVIAASKFQTCAKMLKCVQNVQQWIAQIVCAVVTVVIAPSRLPSAHTSLASALSAADHQLHHNPHNILFWYKHDMHCIYKNVD